MCVAGGCLRTYVRVMVSVFVFPLVCAVPSLGTKFLQDHDLCGDIYLSVHYVVLDAFPTRMYTFQQPTPARPASVRVLASRVLPKGEYLEMRPQ